MTLLQELGAVLPQAHPVLNTLSASQKQHTFLLSVCVKLPSQRQQRLHWQVARSLWGYRPGSRVHRRAHGHDKYPHSHLATRAQQSRTYPAWGPTQPKHDASRTRRCSRDLQCTAHPYTPLLQVMCRPYWPEPSAPQASVASVSAVAGTTWGLLAQHQHLMQFADTGQADPSSTCCCCCH